MKIRETEYAKLASLETELKKKIIGQDDAVHLVAQAVKRSRADLSGRRRPASFYLCGAHRRGQDGAGEAAGKPAL